MFYTGTLYILMKYALPYRYRMHTVTARYITVYGNELIDIQLYFFNKYEIE